MAKSVSCRAERPRQCVLHGISLFARAEHNGFWPRKHCAPHAQKSCAEHNGFGGRLWPFWNSSQKEALGDRGTFVPRDLPMRAEHNGFWAKKTAFLSTSKKPLLSTMVLGQETAFFGTRKKPLLSTMVWGQETAVFGTRKKPLLSTMVPIFAVRTALGLFLRISRQCPQR